MKTKFIICTLILTINITAQTDSLKKIKFIGCSAEIGAMANRNLGTLNIADYKKIAPSDALLNSSFNDYSSSFYFGEPQGFNDFPAIGLKAFFNLQKKGKLNKEVFVGIKYRNTILSALSLSGNGITDTVAVYTSLQTPTQIYQISSTSNRYSFAIVAKQLFLPIGFNITTNKLKRVWLTAGIEVAPGITFNQQYRSFYWQDSYTSYNYSSNNPYNQISNGEYSQTFLSKKIEYINKIDFNAYAVLPLSINLRLSKKIKILKNINLSATISPGIIYNNSSYTKSTYGGIISSAIGFRVNW